MTLNKNEIDPNCNSSSQSTSRYMCYIEIGILEARLEAVREIARWHDERVLNYSDDLRAFEEMRSKFVITGKSDGN